ncbi:hypothetical protein DPMN_157042, partial [Dreissena polymorpha]
CIAPSFLRTRLICVSTSGNLIRPCEGELVNSTNWYPNLNSHTLHNEDDFVKQVQRSGNDGI